METPISTRRVTRSQSSARSVMSKEAEMSAKSNAGGGGADRRAALIDITNDSPIVGLAAERVPLSASHGRSTDGTPGGRGESLLRDQVKTLLQQVQDDGRELHGAAAAPRLPLPQAFLGVSESPRHLLAPTPANTPQISGIPVAVDALLPVAVEESVKVETPEECNINRALLFDSPEKTESSDASSIISSTVTFEDEVGSGGSLMEKQSEDDSSSVWSLQVNISTHTDDDDDEEEEEAVENDEYSEQYEADELCESMRMMSMADTERDAKVPPAFAGWHSRFVYNSDDEMVGQETVVEGPQEVSPGVVLLKGLPVPEGKHLRFNEDDDAE